MKTISNCLLLAILLITGCTKTESDFTATAVPLPVVTEFITLTATGLQVATKDTVTFTVTSSTAGNVTAQSTIYVNGTAITGSRYVFAGEGTYAVYAQKASLATPVVTVVSKAVAVPVTGTTGASYVHRAFVEEYSGTWCGNCPQILYGVDLLEQQTNKAVVVSIHLFGNDPFICTDGNALANKRSVYGVPTGHINRVIDWQTPQYNNVQQAISGIANSSNVGLAINSSSTGSTIATTVKVTYGQSLTTEARLNVYLVEDNLTNNQSNYYSNLYTGAGTISNFKYNGVVRKIITAIDGDVIASSGTDITKSFSVPLPSNVSKLSNTKLVAFVTDGSGKVINVISAPVGTNKDYEKL